VRVYWTEPSEIDLDGLVEHVAQDTLSGALTMDARIRDEARRLADFPESGRVGKVAGTRELVVPRY
jgi:plasmid stabilization system protein ParE